MNEIREELLDILEEIDPDVDYENEKNLIDGKVLDSFSIINLISEICETFDIEIGPKYMVNANFNSVDAMCAMIQKIQDED